MKKSHILASLLALAFSCRFTIDGEDSTGGAVAPEPVVEPLPEAPAYVVETLADPIPEPVADVAEIHPAHRVLDEMEAKLNALGSFAVAELQGFIASIRSLL